MSHKQNQPAWGERFEQNPRNSIRSIFAFFFPWNVSKGWFANQGLKPAKQFVGACSCPKAQSLRSNRCPAPNRGCSGPSESHQQAEKVTDPRDTAMGRKANQTPNRALNPWPEGGYVNYSSPPLPPHATCSQACKETTIPFSISGATPSTFLKLLFPRGILPSEIWEGLIDTWRVFQDIVRTACACGAAQPVWERHTRGRSKKLLDIRSLNLRWVFTAPCSTCPSDVYK